MDTKKDLLISTIIKCAEKVHELLGYGFNKAIYQQCLEIEFEYSGIVFEREVKQRVYYRGIPVNTHNADFVINNEVIVEITTYHDMEDAHLGYVDKYVDMLSFEKGLLINFGATNLQHKLVSANKNVLSLS